MNEFRPTVGIEFDDKYVEAKAKLIELVKALNALTAEQSRQLASEFLTSMGMAASFEQFVGYMNNGGQM